MQTDLCLPLCSWFSLKSCLHCLHFHIFLSLLSWLQCDSWPQYFTETVLSNVMSDFPDTKLMDIFQNLLISQIHRSLLTTPPLLTKAFPRPVWPYTLSFPLFLLIFLCGFLSPLALKSWYWLWLCPWSTSLSPYTLPRQCYGNGRIYGVNTQMRYFQFRCPCWSATGIVLRTSHSYSKMRISASTPKLLSSPITWGNILSCPSAQAQSLKISLTSYFIHTDNITTLQGFSWPLVAHQSSWIWLIFLSWYIPSNLSRHTLFFFF